MPNINQLSLNWLKLSQVFYTGSDIHVHFLILRFCLQLTRSGSLVRWTWNWWTRWPCRTLFKRAPRGRWWGSGCQVHHPASSFTSRRARVFAADRQEEGRGGSWIQGIRWCTPSLECYNRKCTVCSIKLIQRHIANNLTVVDPSSQTVKWQTGTLVKKKRTMVSGGRKWASEEPCMISSRSWSRM